MTSASVDITFQDLLQTFELGNNLIDFEAMGRRFSPTVLFAQVRHISDHVAKATSVVFDTIGALFHTTIALGGTALAGALGFVVAGALLGPIAGVGVALLVGASAFSKLAEPAQNSLQNFKSNFATPVTNVDAVRRNVQEQRRSAALEDVYKLHSDVAKLLKDQSLGLFGDIWHKHYNKAWTADDIEDYAYQKIYKIERKYGRGLSTLEKAEFTQKLNDVLEAKGLNQVARGEFTLNSSGP